MSLSVYGKDKKGLVVRVEDLKVIRRKLQEQEEELKKKIKAQHEKKEKIEEKSIAARRKHEQEKAEYDKVLVQQHRANEAVYTAKCPAPYWPPYNRKIKSCEKKQKRYQRTIDELKNEEFCIDLQIRLQETRTQLPAYDDDSLQNRNSLAKDMTMSNDELLKTAHESKKNVGYLQLKPLAKFGHDLKKPVILMKNRISKLFSKRSSSSTI